MPPPLSVDKEAVRVLVVAVGVREAARQMNLNENTVCAWSDRGGWLDHLKPENQPKLPASMQPTIAIGAIKPAEALVNTMQDDSKACRAATLRYGRRVIEKAADLAEESPLDALSLAPDVSSAVKSAALAGEWQQPGGSSTVINIALIGRPLADE